MLNENKSYPTELYTNPIEFLYKQIMCLQKEINGGIGATVHTDDTDTISFDGDGSETSPLTANFIGDIPVTTNLQSATDSGNTTTNAIYITGLNQLVSNGQNSLILVGGSSPAILAASISSSGINFLPLQIRGQQILLQLGSANQINMTENIFQIAYPGASSITIDKSDPDNPFMTLAGGNIRLNSDTKDIDLIGINTNVQGHLTVSGTASGQPAVNPNDFVVKSQLPSPGADGTVTSVGMTVPTAMFSITGSPVTTAGNFVLGLKQQVQGTFLAGPSMSGSSMDVPVFREIEAADIPALNYVPPSAYDEQIVSTSGVINNLTITSNVVRFTGAGVVLTGIIPLSSKLKTLVLINTSGGDINIQHQSTSSTTTNQIFVLGTGLTAGDNISLSDGAAIRLEYSNSKWRVTNWFGDGYHPNLRGTSTRVVEVLPNGKEQATESFDYEVFRPDLTVEQTDTMLNVLYPDAFRGTTVVAKNIVDGGIMYKMDDDVSRTWIRIPLLS